MSADTPSDSRRASKGTVSAITHVACLTPAKLNLFLELHHKRGDGYHELATVMVAIDRYDHLELRRHDAPEVTLVSGRWEPSLRWWQSRGATADVPSGAANLVVKALERFRQQLGIDHGYQVWLRKRIPAAAGLGGASSNAAAAIAAAARLAAIPPNDPRCLAVAESIGSDVPFFLGTSTVEGQNPPRQTGGLAHAAVGTGRGEKLEPCRIGGTLHFIVLFPPEGLSTATVYRHSRIPAEPKRAQPIIDALAAGRPAEVAKALFNRLAVPARDLSPWVDRSLQELRRAGSSAALMTGSGSACFGICSNAAAARRMARVLQARRVGVAFAASSCAPRPRWLH
jgi:4-diphosphocytidyl-2-C-methyl-D-erythritol kinase